MTTPRLPSVYIVRHGETEWSLAGKHTGLTDLPLTAQGEQNARLLAARLRDIEFARVFTSPLLRARQTCQLAGFGKSPEVDGDLVEWDYGDYEGLTTAAIREARSDWQLFRDGCPGGESLAQVASRADRVVQRLRTIGADALLFSSGHFLRVLGARWCELSPQSARSLALSTASLSVLGYEHSLAEPVIRLWNDVGHLGTQRALSA